MKKPTVLVILDGFGHSPEKKYNAIAQARTPNLDTWFANYPHTLLQAAGKAVGLLEEDIGNSEVGHLTIGAGRIIPQPVTILHDAIENGSLFNHPLLLEAFNKIKKQNSTLHIMGLLSDASVHSHEKHLHAFLDSAAQQKITNIFIHPFLDGRDVPPQSAQRYLQRLDKKLTQLGVGKIGSIHGRFYAMDRDNNWDRTEKSYQILTQAQSNNYNDWQTALEAYYAQNITDEFIPPIQLDPQSIIKNDDGILFFNFRPDRARQITACFVDHAFNRFEIQPLQLSCFVTPVSYNDQLKTTVLFPQKKIENTLKQILSTANKTIFTVAETEKYAHITYFFSGGYEKAFPGETQLLIPSIRAKNYIKLPQMSADEITKAVLYSLNNNPHDFYLINYANADMVGHSGNLEATIKAIEYLDEQLKKLYDQIVTTMDGTLYITADHGNAENMFDETTGQPRTAHTNNPVPFLLISSDKKEKLNLKQLADIAPFILKQMGLSVPDEMKR